MSDIGALCEKAHTLNLSIFALCHFDGIHGLIKTFLMHSAMKIKHFRRPSTTNAFLLWIKKQAHEVVLEWFPRAFKKSDGHHKYVFPGTDTQLSSSAEALK